MDDVCMCEKKLLIRNRKSAKMCIGLWFYGAEKNLACIINSKLKPK